MDSYRGRVASQKGQYQTIAAVTRAGLLENAPFEIRRRQHQEKRVSMSVIQLMKVCSYKPC